MILVKPKILIIDDEPRMVEVLTLMLEDADYRVIAAFNGKDGLRAAYQEHPDLILLDIMMPGMDGFQVLDTLRLVTDIPIIMLTAAGHDPNRVRGMDKGVTDFIIKGTSSEVLLAHIRARLRPAAKWKMRSARQFGDSLIIDITRRKVQVNDKPVRLTPLQWKLLQCLIEKEGELASYDDLLNAGWENPDFRTSDSVKVQISLLREKLRDSARPSRYIHTIREEGYIFEVR